MAWSNEQFIYRLNDQKGFHFINLLTNVLNLSNRQFVNTTTNSTDRITYLLQSAKNRSLDLLLYPQANRNEDHPLVNRSLRLQFDQNVHDQNLHNLTLKFEQTQQVPVVYGDVQFDLDLANSTLRIPFNSSLNLMIHFQKDDPSTKDYQSLHLFVNPMTYDHRLEMIFENVSASKFLEKQNKFANLFSSKASVNYFITVLSTESRGSDLRVVLVGFPEFVPSMLTDILDSSCAVKNGQFNATKYEKTVKPYIEGFHGDFGMNLKECSVNFYSVESTAQRPEHVEIWFDLVRVGPRTDPSSNSTGTSAGLVILLLWFFNLLAGVRLLT